MQYLKELFSDKDGNLSAKRIVGAVTILSGIFFVAFRVGEPDLVKALIYAGFVALGITAFERKL